MSLTPEQIKELDNFYGYQEPKAASALTPEQVEELDKFYGHKEPPPNRSIGEKALRLGGIGTEGVLAGLAGTIPDMPLMALQAGARIPGWLLQALPETSTERGMPVSKAAMNMPPETAIQQHSVVPALREVGTDTNQQISDFTQRLTGKPFYSVTGQLNEGMNKATGLTPETPIEEAVSIGSQVIGGGKSGNLWGKATELSGAPRVAENLTKLGATGKAQELSNILAGTGAGVASQTENKYDDFLLPLATGLAPSAYQSSKRLAGKFYDFDPNRVRAMEDAGIDITAQGASRSENKQNVLNRQASTFGGRHLRERAEQSSDSATRRLTEEGYDPTITQQQAGQSAVKGMEASTAFDEAGAGLLKGRVTENLQGQSILVPGNWADEIAGKLAPQDADRRTLDGLRAIIEKESTLDPITNKRVIGINTLNKIKAEFGNAIDGSSAEKVATSNAVYSAVKDVEMQAARASDKSVKVPFSNETVLMPEATDLYNEGYREVLAQRKQLVDRATKPPITKGGEDLYGAKSLEQTARLLHSDVKQNPSWFEAYSDMLTPSQKKDILALNMKEFGGGEQFNSVKWADEINNLESPSLKAMTYGDAEHAANLKTLAKGIELNKNTVGFAGKPEVSFITSNPIEYAFKPFTWMGRTAANIAFGRMLADPEVIKIMAGLVKAPSSKLPIGAYTTQLNLIADKYIKEYQDEQKNLPKGNPSPTPDSDTIPPAIEPALDTVGGGAGDDTLSPSFGGLRSMMPKKSSVDLKSSYKPRKERITITPSSSVPNDIIKEEGTRLSAYKDTKGKITVGTGFNMDSPNARKVWQEAGLKTPFQAVKRGRLAITPTEAKQLAAKSYEIALNDAKRIYPNFGKLSKNRQRALANISYQMGLTTLSEFKDANNAIRNGKFNAAVRHFARSAWAKKQTPERAKRILAMLERDVPYEES